MPGVEACLVVSQPDRPSGRGLHPTPTPVSEWAQREGIPLLRTADINADESRAEILGSRPDLMVVVAFGQKIGPALLAQVPAINLHGSLLPAWRGAAPVQRSLMEGDAAVGVSVIRVADRMDAGEVYATASTAAGPQETAGELHDRLAALGADPLCSTVEAFARALRAGRSGSDALASLQAQPQDESLATRARKLTRADATVDFSRDAEAVRARINGLSPWPGCDAALAVDGAQALPVRLVRARVASTGMLGGADGEAGLVSVEGLVRCGRGGIEVLEAQLPGGKPMHLSALLRGRRIAPGARVMLRSGS